MRSVIVAVVLLFISGTAAAADWGSDAELRSFWAQRLEQRRIESGNATAPGLTTTTTTTTTIAWTPADECANVPNPGPVILTRATMRWCPMVATHLFDTGRWEPGDLFRFLLSMECESNGDPNATNRSSGTAGLFQHRPRYWADRSTKALGRVGDIYDPHDNIHTAVWLQKHGGQDFHQAWDGCWSQSAMRETWRRGT